MKGIDFVIHAAALKQVPAAEYNPMECIKTNIHGAENVDRGVRWTPTSRRSSRCRPTRPRSPINLYGATKLASDKLFVAANNMAGGHRTRFASCATATWSARRGSVVPFFQKLLARRRRSPADHRRRMTRFWIIAAAGRRLRAQELRTHARRRDLRAEDPVGAHRRSRSGDGAGAARPGSIGIRPGEKLHEVMCPADDSHLTLRLPRSLRHPADHQVLPQGRSTMRPTRSASTAEPVAQGFEYNSGTNDRFP